MKRLFQTFSLKTVNLLGVVTIFGFMFFLTLLIIFQEYRSFEQESTKLRISYIESQKLKAKDETLRVLNYMHHFYHTMKEQMDEEKLRESIVSSIEQLFDRKSGTSYIFIYTTEGINVSDPNKPYNLGKNLIDFQDPNGKYVIKELIEKAKKGGGYVEYMWDNPLSKKPSSKISYAALFEEWEWMIGTGVYFDEVEEVISQNREKLKERMIQYTVDLFVLSMFLYLVIFFVMKSLNRLMAGEMETLRAFFKDAAKHNIVIDKEQIRIGEFKSLATYVNEMVEAIHQRSSELQELNISLEEKVAAKTSELQEQIESNLKLVQSQDSFIKHSIHEINTPLAVMMTHIDMHKMKYGENEYLSKIEAGAKMLATIYDDLEYVVKKDRNEYLKREIDLGAFLEQRVAFFEEIAKGNGYEMICEAEQDITIIFSDVELQRIIDNNLSNAIKYAKRSTPITVRLYKEHNEAILEFITHSKKIADTQKIFEAFEQESRREGGFGLGLEIVGAICDKEEVTIDVSSDENLTIFSYAFKIGKGL